MTFSMCSVMLKYMSIVGYLLYVARAGGGLLLMFLLLPTHLCGQGMSTKSLKTCIHLHDVDKLAHVLKSYPCIPQK